MKNYRIPLNTLTSLYRYGPKTYQNNQLTRINQKVLFFQEHNITNICTEPAGIHAGLKILVSHTSSFSINYTCQNACLQTFHSIISSRTLSRLIPKPRKTNCLTKRKEKKRKYLSKSFKLTPQTRIIKLTSICKRLYAKMKYKIPMRKSMHGKLHSHHYKHPKRMS